MASTIASMPYPANDTALQPGMLRIIVEPDGAIVCVEGTGLWSVAQIEEHLREYAGVLARLRPRPARVIVDLRDAGIQPAEVGTALNIGTKACHRDGDRIAMIVSSALSKIQMRRVLDSDLHGYFTAEAAARNWLGGAA